MDSLAAARLNETIKKEERMQQQWKAARERRLKKYYRSLGFQDYELSDTLNGSKQQEMKALEDYFGEPPVQHQSQPPLAIFAPCCTAPSQRASGARKLHSAMGGTQSRMRSASSMSRPTTAVGGKHHHHRPKEEVPPSRSRPTSAFPGGSVGRPSSTATRRMAQRGSRVTPGYTDGPPQHASTFFPTDGYRNAVDSKPSVRAKEPREKFSFFLSKNLYH